MAIWVAQFVGREIRLLDYVEGIGKPQIMRRSYHAESPEVVAGLFSAVERMRLTSSDAVIVAAEQVMLNILEAYAQPDKSFDDRAKYTRRSVSRSVSQ